MEQQNNSSFSMRKIPTTINSFYNEEVDDELFEKIKILELSNLIDKWEQEILFSENGFFSIKGKDVKNKLKTFILELESFINTKIFEMKFSNVSSKEIVNEIKQEKINAIKTEMQIYEQQELKNWELGVYENALNSSITRAVLYKSNEKIINTSLKNGLNVLTLMAEKEQWSPKLLKYRKERFISEFYSSIIDEFILDKNPNAYVYFEKYKNVLDIEEKEKIESSIKELKNNVIAYNWAKELFSYKLSSTEQETEIKNIKDKEIEKNVRRFLSDFTQTEKLKNEEEEKEKNKNNWKEIIEIASKDKELATLYIDFSLKSESIKYKKEYLNKIKKQGYILTDKKQFLSLLSEFFEDFKKFKNKDISNFQHCLSQEDFELMSSFQQINNNEFYKLKLDAEYVFKEIEKNKIEQDEDKYIIARTLFLAKDEYKVINKKEPDIEARDKIIKLVIERFNKTKK